MLSKMITAKFIKVEEECVDWKEVIIKGAKLLEDAGLVEERYKDEILNNFQELGPYMVIAPGILLSHARPESGVIETGISIMTLKNPIEFGSELNDPVKLVITLAAKDSTGHMDMLAKLMELLMNKEDLSKVFNAKSIKDIENIINKY